LNVDNLQRFLLNVKEYLKNISKIFEIYGKSHLSLGKCLIFLNICGSVPDLKLINKSLQDLLVVDGEELVGAKQNRKVNASFLIAGQTEIGGKGKFEGRAKISSDGEGFFLRATDD
jgi:hypothetical protein